MIETLRRPGLPALAVRRAPGPEPTLLFLPGYASDMTGTKAEAAARWAGARGVGSLRFDYRGCGSSEGAFEEGTIGRWLADAEAVLATHAPGRFVALGSSMGGWIALLLARARPDRCAGLVLVAPAPDFTRWGVSATLSGAERAAMARDGRVERPNPYGPRPTVYTRALVDDGDAHALLVGTIAYQGPVRILHGQADPDVPWRNSLDLADRLLSRDVHVTLIKDGDHRLSRPEDLACLDTALSSLPCWG